MLKTDIGDARRVQKNRGVRFEWEVGKLAADEFRGERTVLAVLSVTHHKAGPNYFSGEHTTEDYFSVGVRNEVEEKQRFSNSGFSSRSFTLFSGVEVGRVAAGNRYSAKKLREAVAEGVAMFDRCVDAGDERVLRYFAEGGRDE